MIIIKSIKCIFADILYLISGRSLKTAVDADVQRNLKWDRNRDRLKNKMLRLNHLLLTKREFRSIFYFRMSRRRHMVNLCRIVLPDADAVEISGEIGGGFLVSHYHSVICPKRTGSNFRVGPGAVINGASFGDNVYVASNSTVLGDIQIGSNVIIGAGSVVTSDLAENGVYVGNPARFIKHIDDNDALLNEIM